MTKKILLVDDSRLFYDFMKEIFSEDDVDILWAPTGKEAVNVCSKEHPDLVLVDILLSDMSGVDVIKKLKEACDEINVLVISGLDNEYVVRDAINAGAKDYIIKNVGLEYFRKKILETLKK